MNRIVPLLRAGTFTPAGLCVRAAGAVLLLVIAHLAGWREQVTVLSGTLADGSTFVEAQVKAAVYLAGWFGAVVGAPIFVIAAGLLWFWERRAASPDKTPVVQPPTDRCR
jgi:hypothetical protein